ncbi:hypothetical protein RP20_CCG020581 [Aedes albopictus]|nr:hypothetical protein RP20_CCG020581 [Aedes albopictus]
MSSKKDSQAAATNGTKYEARLCHVVKRADFDGYGFNLHAEKGRPGQYIGKVDDGSPAEAAGLRQGDRIIEVNGTNITTETHKKVVELIKGVPNETKLLVIDPRADAADLKAAIAKSKTDGVNGGGVDVNDNSKQPAEDEKSSKMTNGTKGDSMMMAMENNKPHDVNGKEEMNNKKNSDMSANKATNGDASPKQQQKPAVVTASIDHIIEDTKALSVSPSKVATTTTPTESKKAMNGSSNGSSAATATNGSASKEGPKLNLNMTAAELRAQLAARKKYDPKNDVCDLRKKYEIIQKM